MRVIWESFLTVIVALLAPTLVVVWAQDVPFDNLDASTNLVTSREAPALDNQFTQWKGDDSASCCSLPGFEATASLLYLQPGSGSLEYGTLVFPFPPASPHWVNQAIAPEYSPAFNVGFRYLIPETCNDIRLSWTHFESTDGASFAGDAITNFAGPSYLIGPGAGAYNLGSGHVKFGYDAVNFEAGHLWQVDQTFQIRVFGGVQYGSITQNITGFFSDNAATNTQTDITESNFSGVGPRFGVNAQFNRCNFQFIGDLAAVALIGSQHTRMDFNTVSTLLPDGNPQSFTSPDSTQVVPGLESRLGGAYSFQLGRGIAKIEAGYQALVYVNAINSYTLTQVATPPVVQSAGVFFATAEHLQSNFTAHGPYMSCSWEF